MKENTLAKTSKSKGKLSHLLKCKEGDIKSFDGTILHYRALGEGTPIICCNGLGVPSFFWKYFETFFKHRYQVIVWDYRGHGQSARPKSLENVHIHALTQDCHAVLKALKIRNAVFIGYSLGVQIILEFYRNYPKQVAGLIPCLGTYGRPLETFYNHPWAQYIYEVIAWIRFTFPKPVNWIIQTFLKSPFWYSIGGQLKMVDTSLADKQEMRLYLEHLLKLEPQFFHALVESMRHHSTEDILKEVKVPTLIIGGELDQFTPVWIAKKMHRLIPKSELFIIKKGTHAALLERPELINLRVQKFLSDHFD